MDFGFPLDPGENITRVIHRHWASLVGPFGFAFLIAIASIGLAYLMGRFPNQVPFPSMVMIALITILAVLAVAFFLIAIYVYSHNFLVFTNSRVIESVQIGLFNRRVSQLDFRHIQDATGHRVGVAGTVFNFGDVQIQSAGEQEQFIFHYAPDPVELADDTVELHDQCMRNDGNNTPTAPPTPDTSTPPAPPASSDNTDF